MLLVVIEIFIDGVSIDGAGAVSGCGGYLRFGVAALW